MRDRETARRVAQQAANEMKIPYVIYQRFNNQWVYARKSWIDSQTEDPRAREGTVEVVVPTETYAPEPVRADVVEVAIANLGVICRQASVDLDNGEDMEKPVKTTLAAARDVVKLLEAFVRQEEAR